MDYGSPKLPCFATKSASESVSLYGGLDPGEKTRTAEGFRSIYKPKTGGVRFADLLDKVSSAHPNVRIRFTSPHPKDFPDEVRKDRFHFGGGYIFVTYYMLHIYFNLFHCSQGQNLRPIEYSDRKFYIIENLGHPQIICGG